MIIGIPKEVKKEEYRVAITPVGVSELKRGGHTVLVEESAGIGSGFADADYLDADADMVDKATVFAKAGLIVKVKEPLPEEFGYFRQGQALFTYLHLAPNPGLTDFLLNSHIAALAYETLEKDGALPLLLPMSEIAGRMAPLVGAYFLQAFRGGTGLLPSGVAGVKPAKCVILGVGTVGANAARIAVGIGMEVVALNRGIERLEKLDEHFPGRIITLPLSASSVSKEISDADMVIGAVLVPGGKTPVLITRQMLGTMKKGAVIIDVAIDQGGCCETSRPTTHDDPVYTVDGVIHYCVANMPGAFPRTSTLALTNATLPFVKRLADLGIEETIATDAAIKSALNVYQGKVVHPALTKGTA